MFTIILYWQHLVLVWSAGGISERKQLSDSSWLFCRGAVHSAPLCKLFLLSRLDRALKGVKQASHTARKRYNSNIFDIFGHSNKIFQNYSTCHNDSSCFVKQYWWKWTIHAPWGISHISKGSWVKMFCSSIIERNSQQSAGILMPPCMFSWMMTTNHDQCGLYWHF